MRVVQVKIFVSDKTPAQKFEECRKIKDSLPSDVSFTQLRGCKTSSDLLRFR